MKGEVKPIFKDPQRHKHFEGFAEMIKFIKNDDNGLQIWDVKFTTGKYKNRILQRRI